jgi:hypothetical protein
MCQCEKLIKIATDWYELCLQWYKRQQRGRCGSREQSAVTQRVEERGCGNQEKSEERDMETERGLTATEVGIATESRVG